MLCIWTSLSDAKQISDGFLNCESMAEAWGPFRSTLDLLVAVHYQIWSSMSLDLFDFWVCFDLMWICVCRCIHFSQPWGLLWGSAVTSWSATSASILMSGLCLCFSISLIFSFFSFVFRLVVMMVSYLFIYNRVFVYENRGLRF